MSGEGRAGAEPVAPAAFLAALAPLIGPAPTGLVLAASGGPDSTGLMHLVAACRALADLPPVTVATVDHGLRAGSAAEAAFVLDQARAFGLPARALTWEGPKPGRAVQERARAARYGLLVALCRGVGASHLLTAHTLDDQAETVLFRLARGSGVGGLAGMAPRRARTADVVHARPLLGFPKARLVATCEAVGRPFLSDPSNADPRFARARWRTLLPALAAEGLDAARLGRFAARAGRAEAALRHGADALGRDADRGGTPVGATLDGVLLAAAPAELALRVLGAAVGRVGRGGPVRLDRLETLTAALADAVDRRVPLGRTLGGARVSVARDGTVTVARERPRRRGRNADPAAGGVPAGATEASLGNGSGDAYIEP